MPRECQRHILRVTATRIEMDGAMARLCLRSHSMFRIFARWRGVATRTVFKSSSTTSITGLLLSLIFFASSRLFSFKRRATRRQRHHAALLLLLFRSCFSSLSAMPAQTASSTSCLVPRPCLSRCLRRFAAPAFREYSYDVSRCHLYHAAQCTCLFALYA